MIRVENLAKEFPDLKRGSVMALDHVSFEVRPGEVFGLLGPNGAGKTTCLRILSTVLKPTAGRALVAGYDVAKQPEQVRANIGFMSSNTGIYDRMTAWELVEYYGRLYGMDEARLQSRLAEIFHTLQMDEIRDLLGSKMSTGMKQKVSIARTIVHDPPVLIFDEPTSGLDVLVARAVLKTIESLKSQGKCIIFSTHIMREVEKLCDRVGIIHRGRILALGTLPELSAKYGQPDMEELFFELIQRHDEPGAARAAERTTVRDRGTAQTRETTHTLEAVQTRETVHDRGTAHHREAAKDTAAEWQAPTGRDTAH